MISLSQLKKVKLKRTTVSPKRLTPRRRDGQGSSATKHSGGRRSHEKKRTPENPFKSRLRKRNVIRSPGGTPLVKNNYEMSMGDGLTPLLSNALKKKFHNAKPALTPEHELSKEGSPSVSFPFESSPQIFVSSPAV